MKQFRFENVRNYQRVLDDPIAEKIAWLMDRSIKIGPFSFGLDSLLGFVPGIGDAAGGFIYAVIIARAMQAGVPKSAIMRMVVNVGIDSAVGAIPFIGDIFDFAWKSNVRNLEIYRTSVEGHRHKTKDWSFIALVAALLVLFIAIPLLALIYLARLLGVAPPLT
jgi:hypothetical protein